MASSKALVLQSGIYKQIPDSDTLLTGVGFDRSTAGALAIGSTTATSVELGAASIPTIIQGTIGNTSYPNLILSRTGSDHTIKVADASGTNSGDSLYIVGGGADQAAAGSLHLISGSSTGGNAGNIYIETGSGVNAEIYLRGYSVDYPATIKIGTEATAGIGIGKVGVTTSIYGDLNLNAVVATPITTSNGSFERATTGTLNIGTNSSVTSLNLGTGSNMTTLNIGTGMGSGDSITIGDSGCSVTVGGNLTVNGTMNVLQGTTFDQNVTFKGVVTVGDGTGNDFLVFDSTSGYFGGDNQSGRSPDIRLHGGVSHTIYVGNPISGKGQDLTIRAGGGVSIAGGDLILVGGPGTNENVGGGYVYIRGGQPGSGGDAGRIYIGVTQTSRLELGAGSLYLAFQSNTITLSSGITANFSQGTVNLPLQFQINGSATGTTVTAANLNTLTNGSNADTLHTHSMGTVSVSMTAKESVTVGNIIAAANPTGGGGAGAYKADADNSQRLGVVGFAANNASNGQTVQVITSGEIEISTDLWYGGVPDATDVGKIVYLSTDAGKPTLTPPSGAGNVVQKVGIVSHAGGGADPRVIVQIGDGVTL